MKAFARLHPAVCAVYFIIILFISMFAKNPVISAISLLGGALFCAVMTDRGEKKRDFALYLPLILLITVTNPLFSHNGKTSLFFIGGNAFTLEALIYGGALSLTVCSVLIWCKTFSIVFTSDKLIYLIGKLLPKLSLVISITLRYIPLLKRQAQKVRRAQTALGTYSSDGVINRIRAHLDVFSSLAGWSLENAAETGKSMKSRGYGLPGRSIYSDFRFKMWDSAVLILCAVLLCAVAFGAVSGALRFSFYPEIRISPLNAEATVSYVCFFILSMIPFLLETEAAIRWSFYRLKI